MIYLTRLPAVLSSAALINRSTGVERKEGGITFIRDSTMPTMT